MNANLYQAGQETPAEQQRIRIPQSQFSLQEFLETKAQVRRISWKGHGGPFWFCQSSFLLESQTRRRAGTWNQQPQASAATGANTPSPGAESRRTAAAREEDPGSEAFRGVPRNRSGSLLQLWGLSHFS